MALVKVCFMFMVALDVAVDVSNHWLEHGRPVASFFSKLVSHSFLFSKCTQALLCNLYI